MTVVKFYRDVNLPYFELKICNAAELSYKHHTHEEYSLGIVDSGTSSFWYAGQVAEVSPKALVFLPPNLIHSCNPVDQGNWQYKMLFIEPKWIHGLMASREEFILDKPIISYALEDEDFYTIDQMVESLTSNASPLEKETAILSVFERFLHTEHRLYTMNVRNDRPRLQASREYIQQHFGEKVTLDKLEQVSGINKYHLIRLFKETFKVPPHTYQTLLRVNYAKKELRSQKAIADIALEAGFYDQSHFIKVFKSHTGVTPEKYQKLN